MEFTEAIKTVKSALHDIGSEIQEKNYDGLIVKKLEESNTLDTNGDRKTNQTHIAITGNQMDIFPYVRAEGYFGSEYDSKDDDLKKYYLMQIPVFLYRENVVYLDPNAECFSGERTLVHVSVVRSRRKDSSEQIQLSMTESDSSEFIKYRKIVHTKSYMVLLKRKNAILYDMYCLKEHDGDQKLDALKGTFYKLKGNTPVQADDYFDVGYKKVKLHDDYYQRAREIIEAAYEIDGLDRLRDFYSIKDKTIGIDTDKMTVNIQSENRLKSLFILESSALYTKVWGEVEQGEHHRVFKNEYLISVAGTQYRCRLSSQWKTQNVSSSDNGYNTLVEVINKYYRNEIEVITENDEDYILIYDKKFKLPAIFSDDFSRRFITSLLAKRFVILTGNSGTGKTRIAKRFAEYLQVDFDNGKKNWILVPVGADWTDNTKILGFYNPLARDGRGKYEKTEILKMIELANRPENRNVPFFLILDEMNLSHVERYFADFLSHMETPELPFVIDGYSEGEAMGKLKYPSNLFVIGTVNIDETTYMFSPKVLDRANVIEFKPRKDDVLNMFINPEESTIFASARRGDAEAFTKLANSIQSGMSNLDDAQLTSVKTIFSGIYDDTEKSGYEFAYRTSQEIRQYISAAYDLVEKKEEFEIAKAIDEQLIQKILPKVHGNKKEIGKLLDDIETRCNDNGLTLSAKKIKKMKEKLAQIQYASFI